MHGNLGSAKAQWSLRVLDSRLRGCGFKPHRHHVRIQEFLSGGVQISMTKKALTVFFWFFFSPQLILQKSNGQFQRILSFFKVPEGVQHFPGGVQHFPGGSNCLFLIETHITCDFPGGSGPPVPPLDSHLGITVLCPCSAAAKQ